MTLPLVAGNWKMNTTVESGVTLARDIAAALPQLERVEVAVLPPFTHLWAVRDVLQETPVLLGAQDVFWEDEGAFTGEISPLMLQGWCPLVLVGHSERRHILGEADEEVGRKFAAALRHGLRVIVAVGETEAERDAGATFNVIERQVNAALATFDLPPSAEQFVIAYEPVWAIGTGRTATPDQAQEVCTWIKRHVTERAGIDHLRVLYGGSVTPDNAAGLFAEADIDGALVGGASLSAAKFAAVVSAAQHTATER